ncbi:MAG TPA: MFS transporter [Candidatus Dormibacteraeota bacterium]|jgi:MFS family permease
MTRRRHLSLSSFWFGLYVLYGPVGTSLIPAQVARLVPRAHYGAALGLVLGAGAFFAMALPPLVGAWSDRLRTRWGRRRPILVAGTVGTVLSLVVMLTAESYTQVLVGYTLGQACSNAAAAAYAALIPDVVPAAEVGRASGWLSTMQLAGSATGLAANAALSAAHRSRLTYAVVAVALVVSLLPTLRVAAVEAPVPPAGVAAVAPRGLRRRIAEFLRPLAGGDFAWVVATRLVVTAGISAVTPFTFAFFRDVVGVPDPDVFNPLWLLVVLAAATPFGLIGGRLSDRLGRKRFVYASGGFQALVALVFVVLYPTSVPLVLVLGAVYGVGYGFFVAVDWALACDTLPDRRAGAKDMGLFHVALSLPGNVVPAVAGVGFDALNAHQPNSGFRVVFGGAAVCFVVGTVLVRRIRGVR